MGGVGEEETKSPVRCRDSELQHKLLKRVMWSARPQGLRHQAQVRVHGIWRQFWQQGLGCIMGMGFKNQHDQVFLSLSCPVLLPSLTQSLVVSQFTFFGLCKRQSYKLNSPRRASIFQKATLFAICSIRILYAISSLIHFPWSNYFWSWKRGKAKKRISKLWTCRGQI